VSTLALMLGYADMAVGGVIACGLLIWGALELWWRLTQPARLFADIMAWKRAKAAGTWPPKVQP
jgi:hypothetical protein